MGIRAFINRGARRRKLIRQYLLGSANEKKQAKFEEQLLTGALPAEEMAQVEDEVVYEYMSGALSKREREWFESHYLATPEHRHKLIFFRALKKRVKSLPANDDVLPRSYKRFLPAFLRGENDILTLSFATAILIAAICVGLLIFQGRRGRPIDVRHTQAVFMLSRGPQRNVAGELTRVNIAGDAGVVELQLPVGDAVYESYRAVLTLTADTSVPVFAQDGLEVRRGAGGKIVSFSVPSEVLKRGDYRLRLGGRSAGDDFQEIGIYSFRVIRN